MRGVVYPPKNVGGGSDVVSIDGEEAEGRYFEGAATQPNPDEFYDKEWAKAVLESALANLKEEFEASGRVELYESLQGFLSSEESLPHWGY